MSEILPKKRGNPNPHGSSRVASNRLQDLSKQGRVISGRSLSKSKRVISNRGDMFNEANSSFGEDAINFDLNKNTILSNFEEWIKLSTDNKITSKNSWQFALIDYFHDLNVIKDGDDINFQRASATLDGCVKIYSSRVESVATETGKLLSGLANKKNDDQDDNEEVEGEEGEDNDTEAVKKTRKINRVVESTLVSFDLIKIKKLEQELAIDPLFKKALAEFDEGGAKSLLLNTLSIDKTGRVVFDATTTGNKDNEQEINSDPQGESTNINMSKLENMLFKDTDLESMSICPSIAQLKDVLNDIDQAKTILSDVNNKYVNDEEPKEDVADFDFGNYDDNDFNEDLNENPSEYNSPRNQEEPEEYELGPGNQILDQDLMAYFDETMKSNWRGPEHWKVAAYKKAKNIAESKPEEETSETNEPTKPKPESRRKKENQIIDFFEDIDEKIEEKMFENAKYVTLLKKPNEQSTKLPEDIQYNSTKLTNLFFKPQNSIMYYPKVRKTEATFTDENYFAEQYNHEDRMTSFHQAQLDEINKDDFDVGEDDVFGGIDFNDALDDAGPTDNGKNLLIGGRKVRPEYVNFSRIAKRVDVKLLKDNLWKGIQKMTPPSSPKAEPEEPAKEKKFGDLVEDIGKMYNPEERKDLSTSFCFICLLHLANEHGLAINGNETHDDLRISGF